MASIAQQYLEDRLQQQEIPQKEFYALVRKLSESCLLENVQVVPSPGITGFIAICGQYKGEEKYTKDERKMQRRSEHIFKQLGKSKFLCQKNRVILQNHSQPPKNLA